MPIAWLPDDPTAAAIELQRRLTGRTMRQLRATREIYESGLDRGWLLPHPDARVWLSLVNAEIAARIGHA
jgi:hypothetical protein